jgi:hypothetical protein
MENNVDKKTVSTSIKIEQKILKNVEYFNFGLHSAIFTREI